jgi:hypothetical protein
MSSRKRIFRNWIIALFEEPTPDERSAIIQF